MSAIVEGSPRAVLAEADTASARLLLADEPTGNLDAATGDAIFDLLRRLHSTHGTTTILVTHNGALAARCDRALQLQQGRLLPA